MSSPPGCPGRTYWPHPRQALLGEPQPPRCCPHGPGRPPSTEPPSQALVSAEEEPRAQRHPGTRGSVPGAGRQPLAATPPGPGEQDTAPQPYMPAFLFPFQLKFHRNELPLPKPCFLLGGTRPPRCCHAPPSVILCSPPQLSVKEKRKYSGHPVPFLQAATRPTRPFCGPVRATGGKRTAAECRAPERA